MELLKLLNGCIPHDHSHQVTSEYYVEYLLRQGIDIRQVLDLGCGIDNSIDYFWRKNPGIRWIGLNIEKSPEVEMWCKDYIYLKKLAGLLYESI